MMAKVGAGRRGSVRGATVDEQALINAVFDSPDETDSAQVYADWLDEHGQPDRAALIRARIEFDRTETPEALRQEQRLRERCTSALALSVGLRRKMTFDWEHGLLAATVRAGRSEIAAEERALSDKDLAELASFPFLKTINAFECLTADALGRLSACPNVQRLTFSNEQDVTANQLDAVAKLSHVVQLGLAAHNVDYPRDSPISDAYLTILPAMPQLTHIDLTRANVSDGGLAVLTSLKGLADLNLGGTPVGDAALAHLPRTLRSLALWETEITDEGLARLASFAKLTRVDLSCTQISNAGLAAVGRLKHLRVLSLAGVAAIDDGGAVHLERLRQLRELDVSGSGLSRFRVARLLERTKLKRVRVMAGLDTRRGYGQEAKEVRAFLDFCKEREVFVDVDYE
jgi:uncharacterized protein (TIGR02996 family)